MDQLTKTPPHLAELGRTQPSEKLLNDIIELNPWRGLQSQRLQLMRVVMTILTALGLKRGSDVDERDYYGRSARPELRQLKQWASQASFSKKRSREWTQAIQRVMAADAQASRLGKRFVPPVTPRQAWEFFEVAADLEFGTDFLWNCYLWHRGFYGLPANASDKLRRVLSQR